MLTSSQDALFKELATAGELIFATGPKGVTANIVGEFYLKQHDDEVRLQVEMGLNTFTSTGHASGELKSPPTTERGC